MSFRSGILEYFVAVAEEGQMTRAARRLGVAQPALSQAMAQLEAEFGLILLERHSRGVSLTPAGAVLYEKARLAVVANGDALQTAQALARAQSGTIEFGFVGSPPVLVGPGGLETFSSSYPEIEIHYRELPFPTVPTAHWLAQVDVAACHQLRADGEVWIRPLRGEPRMILMPRRHHLAGRDELTLADVLDETFIGFAPAVDPDWAGFWSLDDHRGGPPRRTTGDRAANPQEMIAAVAMSDAITAIPSSDAGAIFDLLTAVRVIPLLGAAPALIVLAGHEGRAGPPVQTLLAFTAGAGRSAD